MNMQAIERIWHRLRMLVGRSRITLADDSGAAQLLQIRLTGYETMDGALRVAEYGFQSNPPVGTDAVSLHLSGERGLAVVIGTNNQTYRMRRLATGEVAISDDKGRFVLLGAAGIHVQGNVDPILAETAGPITARAGGDIDATTSGGNINLSAVAGAIALTAKSISMVATESIDLQTPAATLEATTLGITAATAIEGALTNDGHNVGAGHEHLPGTFVVGTSSVTGISGAPTP